MFLNTISFKKVKRNEKFTKNNNSKNIKNRIIKFQNKKSNSEYKMLPVNKNNLNNHNFKKSNSFSKIDNPYKKTYFFNDNINNIISNLKNNHNLKTELSTDFSSNIYNNTNTYSSYIPKNKNYLSKSNKLNPPKINEKILENSNFSNLLEKQEKLLLKKGGKRNVKSSIQMPYINNSNNNQYQYTGLYHSNFHKDNKLMKEINDLMVINQKINFRRNRNIHTNNTISKSLDNNINNNLDKDKIINIKIKFSFH